MNSTFYIFGNFNGSYAQFPVDYTQDIFQQLPNRSSFSNTQLVIHRDGNLMYYCYMRKLEQDNFIGFCLLLNDAMIEEIPALFELFDNGISHLALAGEIVKINDNGDIVSNTDSLLSNRQTIQQIANNMMRDLNHLVETRKKLPAQSLAVSQDEIKRFNIRDDAKQIVESALSYAFVFVTKDEDSQNIDSYRSTIKRLKEETERMQKTIQTLQRNNEQLKSTVNESYVADKTLPETEKSNQNQSNTDSEQEDNESNINVWFLLFAIGILGMAAIIVDDENVAGIAGIIACSIALIIIIIKSGNNNSR